MLRELRPRAGHSPVRALYARVEDRFLVVAIGPDAMVDLLGFRRAVANGLRRLGVDER